MQNINDGKEAKSSLKRKLQQDSPILAAQHLPDIDGSIAGVRKSSLAPSACLDTFKCSQ